MEGKIALENHFLTEPNHRFWNAQGKEDRNGRAYAREVERRLLDPALCLREMDPAGIELCGLSPTSPGVQSVADPTLELPRSCNDHAASLVRHYPSHYFSDDLELDSKTKRSVGRGNADRLFSLGLEALQQSVIEGAAS